MATSTNYMCQVSDTVSCGACCGLYNLPNLSQQKLTQLLLQRAKDFSVVPRTEEGLFAFKRKNRGPHRLSRPYPQFHHCPFLGLLGGEQGSVGCLLHPDAEGNSGVDYRSFSWYGEQACRSYFCPATEELPELYQSILKECVDSWYLFGLIATEYVLVINYFKELEKKIGRPVTLVDYRGNKRAIAAFIEFSSLKLRWSYRKKVSPGPCNYFFENGKYLRSEVFRTDSGIRLSQYESIFRELDSSFSSEDEVIRAEQMVEEIFVKAEQALVGEQS